jgi:branched-chain amino acid transport system substrate-binding protein
MISVKHVSIKRLSRRRLLRQGLGVVAGLSGVWLESSPASIRKAFAVTGALKIGVLTDMSGVYSDFSGAGSVTAVNMAVEEFGGTVLNRPVEVISADHQNKADVGSSIAREWYDKDGVDAILDTTNSAVTLAVMAVTKEKNRIIMIGGSSTTKATTTDCTPNSIQYVL